MHYTNRVNESYQNQQRLSRLNKLTFPHIPLEISNPPLARGTKKTSSFKSATVDMIPPPKIHVPG